MMNSLRFAYDPPRSVLVFCYLFLWLKWNRLIQKVSVYRKSSFVKMYPDFIKFEVKDCGVYLV